MCAKIVLPAYVAMFLGVVKWTAFFFLFWFEVVILTIAQHPQHLLVAVFVTLAADMTDFDETLLAVLVG